MPQYDVYKMRPYLYVVDVQSDFIDMSVTRIIIPMDSRVSIKKEALSRLDPEIIIDGVSFTLLTQNIAPVFIETLKIPIGNISHKHQDITAALDFLFHGF